MRKPSRFPRFRFILCLFVLLTTQCSPAAPTASIEDCPEIQKGLAFLMERYNPGNGLLNEAPVAAPHTYWLANDNALAAFTFERLGQPQMSAALKASIQRYGQGSNGLIEVLWGETVAFPPYIAHTELIAKKGEDRIMQELHTGGQRFDDWSEYADLALWGALNAFQQGRKAEALVMYANAMAMYDGVGFDDKVKDDLYDTYKLALALYVGATIQADMPEADGMRAALKAMQNADGGFFTHYRSLNEPAGDANTETTSLALLALSKGCR